MNKLNKSIVPNYQHLPEKIVQFGEGNFLRGFIDWMIQQLNKQGLFNGSIVAIQPTPHGKVLPKLARQDYLYTTVLRGIHDHHIVDEAEINTTISRGINPYSDWHEVLALAEEETVKYIFSNTTEAGLTYSKENYEEGKAPLSYPGKLAIFLHQRYQASHGDTNSGFHIFPCELVENNGELLKSLVLQASRDYGFTDDFREWVKNHNVFYNTLVDRIVTGYPKDDSEAFQARLGYEDELLTVGEPFHLFVIEGPEAMEEHLPFQKAGLNVQWADVKPYRDLKVRILNGLHTFMYALGFLKGKETVLEVVEDDELRHLVDHCLQREILPVIETNEEEKLSFADSVLQRFLNPYNRHLLTDLGLNGLNKFKVRVLPTLFDYVKKYNRIPDTLAYSFAASLLFYRVRYFEEDVAYGEWDGHPYVIKEDKKVLKFMEQKWSLFEANKERLEDMVVSILENTDLWGRDLNALPELREKVTHHLSTLLEKGL